MIDGIEHPDHTGASANPDAPWNQPDNEEHDMPTPKRYPITCTYCNADLTQEESVYVKFGMVTRSTTIAAMSADGELVPPTIEARCNHCSETLTPGE